MAWISPTSYNDPDGGWAYETRAYDEDTGTGARPNSSLLKFLELIPAASLNCDKIRLWTSHPTVDIDVYYEGSWHDVFAGDIAIGDWVEKSIPAGTKLVGKARVGFDDGAGKYLYEFDFNEVAGDGGNGDGNSGITILIN